MRPTKKLMLLLTLLCLMASGVAGARAATKKAYVNYTLYLAPADSAASQGKSALPADAVAFFSADGSSKYNIVLPGTWQLDSLRIYLDGVSGVTWNSKAYQSGDPISVPADTAMTIVPAKGQRITLTATQTGGLPVMMIHTASGSSDKIHASKTRQETGSLHMVNAKGETLYHGGLTQIRIRGNSTAKYQKKPYQIKLQESTRLLNAKKDKTYVLLANMLDKSQIRNTIALALARYGGAFAFVPASQSVDLYLNHDYRGTYLLTEKVEIDQDRLNLVNLEKATENLNPTLNLAKMRSNGSAQWVKGKALTKYMPIPNNPKDITGGYLLSSNRENRYNTEASAFTTSRGYVFTMQEPKYASKAQITYISALFQRIETALTSNKGYLPKTKTHYTDLIDLTSFVHRYILAEMLDDYDGQFCNFYKNSDKVNGKVYVGPPWDFDNILGAGSRYTDPAQLHFPVRSVTTPYWFSMAIRQKDFYNAAIDAYQNIYKQALNILLGKKKDSRKYLRSIDQYAEEVRLSARADLIRWPIAQRNQISQINTRNGKGFDEQIQYLKDYLTARKKALDKAWAEKEKVKLTRRPGTTKTPKPAPATKAPVKTPKPLQATPAPVVTPRPTKTPGKTNKTAPSLSPTPRKASEAVSPIREQAVYLLAAAGKTDAQTAVNPADIYTAYKKGVTHAGVYRLRVRLQELGYIDRVYGYNARSSCTYDNAMVSAVKELQQMNGLKITGDASAKLQMLVYSDQVKGKNGKTLPAPAYTTSAKGPTAQVELPELDSEGLLSKKSKDEFIYKNEKDGLWYYISKDVYVEIRRYVQAKPKLVWFETRVKMRSSKQPASIFARGVINTKQEDPPDELARNAQSVLAITDDYYDYRRFNKSVGYIIRNGGMLFDKLDNKASVLAAYPRMDAMAFLPDGSMAVFERGKVTIDDLYALKVQNSYSFGPVLVKEGLEHPTARYGPELQTRKEPRMAIGSFGPNDYLILTVNGRCEKNKDALVASEGVGCDWLVDKFLEKGVVNAFNLDGGGTASLVFMGERLNRSEVGSKVRGITSMISFGTSKQVPQASKAYRTKSK